MATGRPGSRRRRRQRRRRTWSMVRYSSGARILATWGAKAGDATTTSAVGPVGHDIAGRHHHHPVGGGGHELDVVGGDDHGPTLGGQAVEDADQRPLGPVVEPPGRLVEQHDVAGRRSADGQHQSQPLTLGQVAGMESSAMPGASRSSRSRRPDPRPFGRLPVGLGALLGHRVEVQQVGRGLGHEPDQAPGLGRRQRLGVDSRPTSTVPPWRGPDPWRAHSSDDLPEPLRPISAVTSPPARSRSTPRTATTGP